MKRKIGRYRIDGALGEGGMGIVYAAHDEQLGRDVAIKVLRYLDVDAPARERVWREARAAAAVSHPNICHVYEVGEDEGTIYIAMERLGGEPLSARIARGAMPVDEAAHVALGILAALEALHARAIVHRDLKPANVFLTPHGVKLLDFGVAQGQFATDATGRDARVTRTGVVTGTPRYMAPEQLAGQFTGPASDQFAFGATFFEMLTGRPAFPGDTVWEISHAVLHEQAPALAGSASAAALDRVIRRCLAKRPEERYPDAASIVRDIRAAATLVSGGETSVVRATTRLMVLPLRLLRPDPEIEFLSFSLADSLIASLAGLGTLVVRSSHVAQQVVSGAAGTLDLTRIANEGQVDAVLAGSLLRAGDQVRVVAQLVEAPGGTILWSKTAQVPMGDVFQLQDGLARQILDSLSIPLSARDRGRLGRDIPGSGRAYELYLRANHLAHGTVLRAALLAARELYLAALDEDPGYAPAWARLGRVCRVLAKYSEERDDENLRRAGEAFDRAFALSPDLPLAHHLFTYFELEQLGRAEEAMIRLLGRVRDVPNDPDLFAGLVAACRYCGLLDASLAAHVRARQLDPALPTSVEYTYFLLGDLARLREFGYPDSAYPAGVALMQTGELGEGRRVLLSARANSMAVERLFADAFHASMEGRGDEVRGLMQRLRASGFRDPEGLAFMVFPLAQAGLADEALDLLEQVVSGGYTCPQLRKQPWLAPFAGDQRFEAVIARAEAARGRAAAAFEASQGPRLLAMTA